MIPENAEMAWKLGDENIMRACHEKMQNMRLSHHKGLHHRLKQQEN